ncbi:uncharacterized protein G2W53_037207 [Senna tora]|uniref:Uncharacterized protein n=1 Tax=Senna tora TaxID=362788 RepID=A0A834T623_9FABA|nr:uncharacterized protein G2W53_037207 [Senna tora]
MASPSSASWRVNRSLTRSPDHKAIVSTA